MHCPVPLLSISVTDYNAQGLACFGGGGAGGRRIVVIAPSDSGHTLCHTWYHYHHHTCLCCMTSYLAFSVETQLPVWTGSELGQAAFMQAYKKTRKRLFYQGAHGTLHADQH